MEDPFTEEFLEEFLKFIYVFFMKKKDILTER